MGVEPASGNRQPVFGKKTKDKSQKTKVKRKKDRICNPVAGDRLPVAASMVK
jgi:hypothetical protein